MLTSKALPDGQKWILDYFKATQYLDTTGICYGLSYVWVHYVLIGNDELYDELLHKLDGTQKDNLLALFAKAKKDQIKVVKKAKHKALKRFNAKHQNMTGSVVANEDDTKELNAITQEIITQTSSSKTLLFLALEAFFEAVVLCTFDYNTIRVLDKDVTRSGQCGELTLLSVMSKKLEEAGGIVTLNPPFSGIYSRKDLIKYFRELRKTIANNSNFSKPFAVVLNSYNHTISFTYDSNKKWWKTLDANMMPTYYFASDRDMVDNVLDAFIEGKGNIIALSTYVHTTGKDKDTMQLMVDSWRAKINDLHLMTAEKVTLRDSLGVSWICIAAIDGHLDEVNALLANEHIESALTVMPNGKSPLYHSIKEGHVDVMNAFLAHLSFRTTSNSETMLKIAVKNGNVRIIESLLTNTTITAYLTMPIAEAMLFVAIEKNNVDVVKTILANENINPNLPNAHGETPLMIASMELDDISIAKLLLAHKDINPNIATAAQGETVLMIAVMNGNIELVKYLLETTTNLTPRWKRINANAVTNDGKRTALHIAVKYRDDQMVKVLLKNGLSDDTIKRAGIDLARIANHKCCPEIERRINDRIKLLKAQERLLRLKSSVKPISPFNLRVFQLKNNADYSHSSNYVNRKRKHALLFNSNKKRITSAVNETKVTNTEKRQRIQ
jgi:ankyrin repeat protein